MQNIVAIHQPNFLPWLGYFDKMARCDCFVFLDDVQIQKTGGGWANRVKVAVSGQPKWITAPIDRSYHGVRNINETRFVVENDWRQKVFKTLQANYRRAPYFSSTMNLLEPLLLNPDDNLSTYNTNCILRIASELGISNEKCRRSSSLTHAGQSNELLVSIIQTVNGDAYMCGGGASGYQDPQIFSEASISLVYQNFVPDPYPQFNIDAFVPGLSIVDVLMNIGKNGAREMLAHSARRTLPLL